MAADPIFDADLAAASDARTRILVAASRLIAAGGSDAATTRAVATAAGVQPPTIYRLFGDKRGLLGRRGGASAARLRGAEGRPAPAPGPGRGPAARLGRPYRLLPRQPRPVRDPDWRSRRPAAFAATVLGRQALQRRIRRIAQCGRLSTCEERAVAAVEAAGTGTVLTLLRSPQDEQELPGFRPSCARSPSGPSRAPMTKAVSRKDAAPNPLRPSLGGSKRDSHPVRR